MNEWLIVMVFVLGLAQGLWVGWYIWRQPHLKYKTGETE
jgi:uncharacterized protein YneF (UPF0154 family)